MLRMPADNKEGPQALLCNGRLPQYGAVSGLWSCLTLPVSLVQARRQVQAKDCSHREHDHERRRHPCGHMRFKASDEHGEHKHLQRVLPQQIAELSSPQAHQLRINRARNAEQNVPQAYRIQKSRGIVIGDSGKAKQRTHTRN